jgi:radical SAM protein with 4Fe4S-binding SPASM domain
VVHRGNLGELEALYAFLRGLGISSWRIINVEPMGRACESQDLLLTPAEFRAVLAYIRAKRFDYDCPMEVTYGCSHYLGAAEERMTRDHYFLCGAGIHVASVRANGDICACLDVANLPELVQGNIHRDDFARVWREGFRAFRTDRTEESETCRACPDRRLCGGDSAHTWDWRRHEPLLCGLRMTQGTAEGEAEG